MQIPCEYPTLRREKGLLPIAQVILQLFLQTFNAGIGTVRCLSHQLFRSRYSLLLKKVRQLTHASVLNAVKIPLLGWVTAFENISAIAVIFMSMKAYH